MDYEHENLDICSQDYESEYQADDLNECPYCTNGCSDCLL